MVEAAVLAFSALSLESCQKFREITMERVRHVAHSGLFNTGTNLLEQTFARNPCARRDGTVTVDFQVPWGKHNAQPSQLARHAYCGESYSQAQKKSDLARHSRAARQHISRPSCCAREGPADVDEEYVSQPVRHNRQHALALVSLSVGGVPRTAFRYGRRPCFFDGD
jgi:hypothetical protein